MKLENSNDLIVALREIQRDSSKITYPAQGSEDEKRKIMEDTRTAIAEKVVSLIAENYGTVDDPQAVCDEVWAEEKAGADEVMVPAMEELPQSTVLSSFIFHTLMRSYVTALAKQLIILARQSEK